MNHFIGIFYGNFITTGHYGIYGPLAMGELASILEYSVNVRRLVDCSSQTPTSRLGLYAKTLDSPASLRIYGDLDIQNTPDFLKFVSENFQCKILHPFDKNNFRFDKFWPNAIQMSSFLTSQVSTHVLRADGSVDEVYHTEDQRFYIFHFGPL
ncbi:serine/threonine protein kinase [Mucor velutinosus]|uniref:Serine/threonine protein kinase n=1 Tax=Mucor velutinosus TaxID=708070 RepID=A0AAN7I200_9FUNG|nr:serine/threonine protein kinase [Mucor velutinosus]